MRSQFYEQEQEQLMPLAEETLLLSGSYQCTAGGPLPTDSGDSLHHNESSNDIQAPKSFFRSWRKLVIALAISALAVGLVVALALHSSSVSDKEVSVKSTDKLSVTEQDVFEENSLLFGVNVKTSKTATIYAEYWRKDKEGPRLRSETTPKSLEHTIHFFRLNEIRLYEYQLYDSTGDALSNGRGSFRTGPIPNILKELKLTHVQGEASFLSLTTNPLMEGISKTKPQTAYIFDEDGEIVWYIVLEHPHDKFDGFGFDRAEPENLNIITQGTDRMQLWSPTGKLLKETLFYCPLLHHEGSYDTMDKNYAFTLGSRAESVDGLDNDQLQDVVVRWDIEGDKLEEVIFFMEHMDVLKDRTDASNVPVSLFWEHCPAHDDFNNQSPAPDNWSHVNSVRRSLSGGDEVVCSLKALDQIVAFSPDLKQKIWTLNGFGSDFTFIDMEDKFYHPHDAQMIANGNILVMDNGSTRPRNLGGPYSRALELELDYEKGTAKKVWDYALEIDGKLCESPNGGGAQRLSNGNTLVQLASCSGEGSPTGLISHTIEVSPLGEVVFHLSITVNDLPTYRVLPQTTVGGEVVV